ncbi:fucose-binding lectin II [Streptomyces rubradiris]|uniref:fucose-binding lectin II n=1 Tax=Streptomyces rubradiris TaxID=285531 RepID=UPI0033F3EEA6
MATTASNEIDVKVSAVQFVKISARVNSPQLQRVTIKADGLVPRTYQWTGSGEGVQIGSTEEDRPGDWAFKVTLEASDDGGKTFKPSTVRVDQAQTMSLPPIVIVSVRAESDGDDDYDDAVVHFTYS